MLCDWPDRLSAMGVGSDLMSICYLSNVSNHGPAEPVLLCVFICPYRPYGQRTSAFLYHHGNGGIPQTLPWQPGWPEGRSPPVERVFPQGEAVTRAREQVIYHTAQVSLACPGLSTHTHTDRHGNRQSLRGVPGGPGDGHCCVPPLRHETKRQFSQRGANTIGHSSA